MSSPNRRDEPTPQIRSSPNRRNPNQRITIEMNVNSAPNYRLASGSRNAAPPSSARERAEGHSQRHPASLDLGIMINSDMASSGGWSTDLVRRHNHQPTAQAGMATRWNETPGQSTLPMQSMPLSLQHSTTLCSSWGESTSLPSLRPALTYGDTEHPSEGGEYSSSISNVARRSSNCQGMFHNLWFQFILQCTACAFAVFTLPGAEQSLSAFFV